MKRQLPPNISDPDTHASGSQIKIVYGNLITLAEEGKFDVIGHGCNCHCVMGAGVAKAIKDRWPEAYAADLATKKGDRSKMGTFSFAQVGDLTIINLYTQYDYTRTKVDVEYEALEEGMKRIKEAYSGKRIGFPMIGAGLAGGNWSIIKNIIDDVFEGEDVTVVVFKDDAPKAKQEEKVEDKPQW